MATVKVYRIRDESETLGVIAATAPEIAQAYAIGKYGASAVAERVAVQQALGVHGLCIVVETHLKQREDGRPPIRVISN